MKMHSVETEDITKNHQTKKLVIEKLNKNNICEKKTTKGLPHKQLAIGLQQWDDLLVRFFTKRLFTSVISTFCLNVLHWQKKIKRTRSFIILQIFGRSDFLSPRLWTIYRRWQHSLATLLTNISRPVVKYSETVVHYASNLPLTAIPQVATKVGNTADVTEGHQRIKEK